MGINLKRSLLISLGFMVAHILLRPLGLGWVVTVLFLGFIAYSIMRVLQAKNQQSEVDPSAAEQEGTEDAGERDGFMDRMRGKKDRRGEEQVSRAQEARARAQQEADCSLTHEERVEFQNIVKGLNEAG